MCNYYSAFRAFGSDYIIIYYPRSLSRRIMNYLFDRECIILLRISIIRFARR